MFSKPTSGYFVTQAGHDACGMVVEQDVCNSIQAPEGLILNKVNSHLNMSTGMLPFV